MSPDGVRRITVATGRRRRCPGALSWVGPTRAGSVARSVVVQDRAAGAIVDEHRVAAVVEQVEVEVLVRLLLAVPLTSIVMVLVVSPGPKVSVPVLARSSPLLAVAVPLAGRKDIITGWSEGADSVTVKVNSVVCPFLPSALVTSPKLTRGSSVHDGAERVAIDDDGVGWAAQIKDEGLVRLDVTVTVDQNRVRLDDLTRGERR
jgi:hypothetical protein